jgi:hypothetical protein
LKKIRGLKTKTRAGEVERREAGEMSSSSGSDGSVSADDSSVDFIQPDSEPDNESTLEEAEAAEGDVSDEIAQLQREAEMDIDQLRAMYAGDDDEGGESLDSARSERLAREDAAAVTTTSSAAETLSPGDDVAGIGASDEPPTGGVIQSLRRTPRLHQDLLAKPYQSVAEKQEEVSPHDGPKRRSQRSKASETSSQSMSSIGLSAPIAAPAVFISESGDGSIDALGTSQSAGVRAARPRRTSVSDVAPAASKKRLRIVDSLAGVAMTSEGAPDIALSARTATDGMGVPVSGQFSGSASSRLARLHSRTASADVSLSVDVSRREANGSVHGPAAGKQKKASIASDSVSRVHHAGFAANSVASSPHNPGRNTAPADSAVSQIGRAKGVRSVGAIGGKASVAALSLPQLLARRKALLGSIRDRGDELLDDSMPHAYINWATGVTASVLQGNDELLGFGEGESDAAATEAVLEYGALLDSSLPQGASAASGSVSAAATVAVDVGYLGAAAALSAAPTRSRTHWDTLLEEARWLAHDVSAERRWKIAQAKKLGAAVLRWHELKQRKVSK